MADPAPPPAHTATTSTTHLIPHLPWLAAGLVWRISHPPAPPRLLVAVVVAVLPAELVRLAVPLAVLAMLAVHMPPLPLALVLARRMLHARPGTTA